MVRRAGVGAGGASPPGTVFEAGRAVRALPGDERRVLVFYRVYGNDPAAAAGQCGPSEMFGRRAPEVRGRALWPGGVFLFGGPLQVLGRVLGDLADAPLYLRGGDEEMPDRRADSESTRVRRDRADDRHCLVLEALRAGAGDHEGLRFPGYVPQLHLSFRPRDCRLLSADLF